MKEFEKWINRDLGVCYGTIDEDSAAKDGWRAALEWVIAECQEDGWGDCIALNVGKIEEEFEEENIYNQDQWCESCRLKIEAAEDMEVVSVCNTCVKRNLK